ncbi:MAG: hypothetical protein HY507_00255 [Candidatus Zambryskibacteria bacterium]|nr:hypothetical protein [Candidatus Zambryskibacteria bacterium]
MYPLTIFPALLTFGLIAPLLLRLSVGILRLFAGYARYHKKFRWLSIFYAISSLLLIIGLYTQIAAIVAILLIIFDYYTEKKSGKISREQNLLTILMLIILISLLFTGPGFLAFDLPL